MLRIYLLVNNFQVGEIITCGVEVQNPKPMVPIVEPGIIGS